MVGAFSYSFNSGKLSDIDTAYWKRIVGGDSLEANGFKWNNIGTVANSYKNLYGSELSISEGYKFFEAESGETPEMQFLLSANEIKYKSNETLSRTDIYKEAFLDRWYSSLGDNSVSVSGVFQGTGSCPDIWNISGYQYEAFQRNADGTYILDENGNKQSIGATAIQNLTPNTANLQDLYLQLEEEANSLKATLYEKELAYGGYPEIAYTAVDAQHELMKAQLDLEMQNFANLMQDMYATMKINAGGHSADNGNNEDALRLKEQEAATAATITATLALQYAEKYYNHNIKPNAEEYIFAQAFMINNTGFGLDKKLGEMLANYSTDYNGDKLSNEPTKIFGMGEDNFKYTTGNATLIVDDANSILYNQKEFELRQELFNDVKQVIQKDILFIHEGLSAAQTTIEEAIKSSIAGVSIDEGGLWKDTLKVSLSTNGVNISTINNIIANIESNAEYYYEPAENEGKSPVATNKLDELIKILNTQEGVNKKIHETSGGSSMSLADYQKLKANFEAYMSYMSYQNSGAVDKWNELKNYLLKGTEIPESSGYKTPKGYIYSLLQGILSHFSDRWIDEEFDNYFYGDEFNVPNYRPEADNMEKYLQDVKMQPEDPNSVTTIAGVGDENVSSSNLGALKDYQLAEIGDTLPEYITWMVRDFFGVGGLTTDIKDTSYCFTEADPIAAKLIQSAENLVKINMEMQKLSIEASVNNQIRAEYEARLGAMEAINEILANQKCIEEGGTDPYNVEINGEKYILGKDINDDKVINSIVEILGANDSKENIFSSLKGLDTDNDGYVSNEELLAHNIILNKVDDEGKLTSESFDMSKIKGISLSELEHADGTNNVFGLFKIDLESARANGTVTFENDAYFENLFSNDDILNSVDEIDVESVEEVMPETQDVDLSKKFSFNLANDDKNIFEKLFDELCWKMGITNISTAQKDNIIDSFDEDLDIDIVEVKMQEKLDSFNLSA